MKMDLQRFWGFCEPLKRSVNVVRKILIWLGKVGALLRGSDS